FNIPYSESRDRFAETLEILRKAWTQERFSHDGKYFQFNDVCIMPKPYQKPHPPIRIAASTPETYPMVARMGRRSSWPCAPSRSPTSSATCPPIKRRGRRLDVRGAATSA